MEIRGRIWSTVDGGHAPINKNEEVDLSHLSLFTTLALESVIRYQFAHKGWHLTAGLLLGSIMEKLETQRGMNDRQYIDLQILHLHQQEHI
jgi:hypothetical protein